MFFAYEQIISLLLRFRYIILFPFVMFEGPVTTIIAGFLSSIGYMHFWIAYAVVAVADVTSDIGYYALGRFGREKFIERHGHRIGITPERIAKLERHFENHGGKMLLFGKIADPLSSAIQTTAGLSRMPLKRYLTWNVSITFPKSLILLTIGFYFGQAIHEVNAYRQAISIAISVIGVALIAAYFIYRRIAAKKIDA